MGDIQKQLFLILLQGKANSYILCYTVVLSFSSFLNSSGCFKASVVGFLYLWSNQTMTHSANIQHLSPEKKNLESQPQNRLKGTDVKAQTSQHSEL